MAQLNSDGSCQPREEHEAGRAPPAPDPARGRPAVDTPLDLTLARALAKAELWKERLSQGEATSLAQLPAEEKVDPGYLRRALRLAFLSPNLKRAVLEGSAPVGLTLQHLMTHDLPVCWAEQERRAALV